MQRYSWARRGDVNAFFGLMLDNVAVMIILVTTLAGTGLFSPGFVLTRMIPGTALGVLIGDLVYTWMAFRLARRTGRSDVTAMPLGLDTPSTFGVAFLILIPARLEANNFTSDPERAMEFAWHVGLVTLLMVGVFKTFLSPLGNAVRNLVPRAGLLGSLAAIALTLIAFLPLLLDGIAAVPVVGLLALIVVLVTLVAHRELPFRFPGALGAVVLGVGVYWFCHLVGWWMNWSLVPPPTPPLAAKVWQPASLMSFYGSDGDWWQRVLGYAVGRLPVALPFALATIVGGIDCTESAAAAGDTYDTRAILFTEGAASLVAGLLGGVIQTTPYIGHPAYKKMGGAAAYTLAAALFIGIVGCVGGFTWLYAYLPTAAMFPIFVFVGLEITAQSFHATPTRHYPALALAMLPALAYLITVPFNDVTGNLGLMDLLHWPDPASFPEGYARDRANRLLVLVQTLRCLANGFLISGMLWAAALALILDGRMRAAAVCFLIAGLCALVGIIHSPLLNERIDLPWRVLEQVPDAFKGAVRYQTPYHWAAAYGLTALLLIGLDLGREVPAATEQQEPWGESVGAALPADEGIQKQPDHIRPPV
jgi:AGZA family xanthine/uracil permease-like MFS transporter